MAKDLSQYNFEVVPGWPNLPEEYVVQDVCGIEVDADETVYIIHRGKNPVLVLDKNGKVLNTWGDGEFIRAHDICISPDGFIWTVDDDNHCVKKFTKDGKLLQTIGTPGKPSDTGVVGKDIFTQKQAAPPFCYPTGIAFLKKTGEFFVCDGYGNSCVHRFSPDGKYIASFGKPGSNPGEFRLPHAIDIGENGLLYVADRENDRIQVFEPDGKVVDVWEDVIYRPQDILVDKNGNIVVIELGFRIENLTRKPFPNGVQPWSRVTVLSPDGKVIKHIGGPDGFVPGNIHGAHTVALSPSGDMYTGEVVLTLCGWTYPEGAHALQKFNRV